MYASYCGHTDAVHALLSGGAQPDLQDKVSIVYLCYRTKVPPLSNLLLYIQCYLQSSGNYVQCDQI